MEEDEEDVRAESRGDGIGADAVACVKGGGIGGVGAGEDVERNAILLGDGTGPRLVGARPAWEMGPGAFGLRRTCPEPVSYNLSKSEVS